MPYVYKVFSPCPLLLLPRYNRTQSRVLVYFVIGEFYQNWTSPLVPTMDTAQDYTKSFAFGDKLQRTITSRLAEGSLFSNICILESDIITEPPVVTTQPPVVTGTLIAVIVVVIFFVLAVCVMVFCICCYCYFAQKDQKEANQ